MKTNSDHLNKHRVKQGIMGSTDEKGLMGSFILPTIIPHRRLFIISSGIDNFTGWEHVSIHVKERKNKKVKEVIPTWSEMCVVKALFWEPEECVIQFHPPESQYVNMHAFTLHLWKQIDKEFPMPDKSLVG